MTIIQWLVFRGVGHAQVGTDPGIAMSRPVVACGRTSWPGVYRYAQDRPKHLCPDCAVALGIGHSAAVREGVVERREPEPKKPSQGNLF